MDLSVQTLGGLPNGAKTSSGRIGTIDTLRCFAMSAVIAQHCGLLPCGWIGVWLFFIISGHVVTLSVLEDLSTEPPARRLLHFYRRRILRIVPVYYAYLAVGTAVCLAADVSIDWRGPLSLMGFFHNVAMEAGGGNLGGWPVAHLWTISVEMQFYALYGFILVFASRRSTLVFLVAALAIAPLSRALVSSWLVQKGVEPLDAAFDIYSGPLLHIDAFAAGALLAFARQAGRLRGMARPLIGIGATTIILYGTLYLGINRYVVETHGIDTLRNIFSGILWGEGRQVLLYSAILPATAGIVALAATRDISVEWLLGNPLLQRIGEISYGGYIFHPLAIVVASHLLSKFTSLHQPSIPQKVALFALAFTLTVIAAELSYRFFETRFTRRRRGTARLASSLP